jgi:hypothetical protein
MPGALIELVEAYSSNSSSNDREESAHCESINLSGCEDSFSDDVITGEDEKASEKPKSFGPKLQLHNYFLSPASHRPKKRSKLLKILIFLMLCIQKES